MISYYVAFGLLFVVCIVTIVTSLRELWRKDYLPDFDL